MVCLYGTVPISYRGRMYNIPVVIWIPHSYPHTSPFVFVTPTDSMVIKESKNVELTGKVHLPYLTYWPSHSEHYNLVELVRILCVVFGQQPPVYNKAPKKTNSPIKTTNVTIPSVAHLNSTNPMDVLNHHTSTSNPLISPYASISSLSKPLVSTSLSPHPSNFIESTLMNQPVESHNVLTDSSNRQTVSGSLNENSHTYFDETTTSNYTLQSAVVEKIQKQIKTIEQTKTREMETLLRINSQLKDNSQKLVSGQKLLVEEGLKIDTNIDSLHRKIQDMKNLINSSETERELDADEILLPNNTIHRQ